LRDSEPGHGVPGRSCRSANGSFDNLDDFYHRPKHEPDCSCRISRRSSGFDCADTHDRSSDFGPATPTAASAVTAAADDNTAIPAAALDDDTATASTATTGARPNTAAGLWSAASSYRGLARCRFKE
jgi:hypothetical protein